MAENPLPGFPIVGQYEFVPGPGDPGYVPPPEAVEPAEATEPELVGFDAGDQAQPADLEDDPFAEPEGDEPDEDQDDFGELDDEIVAIEEGELDSE